MVSCVFSRGDPPYHARIVSQGITLISKIAPTNILPLYYNGKIKPGLRKGQNTLKTQKINKSQLNGIRTFSKKNYGIKIYT